MIRVGRRWDKDEVGGMERMRGREEDGERKGVGEG